MRSFLPLGLTPVLAPALTTASAALAACAPAPQEPARAPDPVAGAGQATGAPLAAATPPVAAAAQGPVPEPVSAAENPYLGSANDAEALGRRTLSTAFVQLGPDEHLLVELRDGQVLGLGDVTMGKVVFCGVTVTGDVPGKRQCRRYGDVTAASPRAARHEAAIVDNGLAASPR